MPSAPRNGLVVLAALATLRSLAGCGSGATAPRSCAADADCPAASRCLSSACVANAAPVPAVVLPAGPLEANALVSFDGSSSADPDAGDSIVSYAWSFRAMATTCEPPAAAGDDAVATVRFACEGRYAVDLTVTDEMPASATVSREFDVVRRSGPELVTAGANVELEHVCSSLPTRCVADGEIRLSAAADGFAPEEVSFEWAVEPPANRPLDANRRVTFSPSAFVDAPSVAIETDGQAISGNWIFRVRVRDAAGLVGSAATVVAVRNRPPVVQKTIPVVDHAFSAAARRLTAAGEIPFSVTDPDGDALVGPLVEFRHAGDGDAATFSGALAADPLRVAFEIVVPFERPADALHLIDDVPGALERTIVFGVTDVNGGAVAEQWPIVVANRPPVLVAAPATFTVEHVFDPVALAYEAVAVLSTWSDPDGDPLFQVPEIGTGDPLCPEVLVQDGAGPRPATVACSLPFAGTPIVANFAGAHTVMQAIQDPWATAVQASAVTFTIGNRAPLVVSPGPVVVSSSCSICGTSCGVAGEPSPSYCVPETTLEVPSGASDPDGDPVQISAPPNDGLTLAQPLVCTSAAECTLPVSVEALVRICGGTSLGPLAYTATDGLSTSAAGSVVVDRTCTNF